MILNEDDINSETLHTMALKINQRTLTPASMERTVESILYSLPGDCRATAQLWSCGGPGAGASP